MFNWVRTKDFGFPQLQVSLWRVQGISHCVTACVTKAKSYNDHSTSGGIHQPPRRPGSFDRPSIMYHALQALQVCKGYSSCSNENPSLSWCFCCSYHGFLWFWFSGCPAKNVKKKTCLYMSIGDDGACCWSDPGKFRDRWVSQPTRMEPPGEKSNKMYSLAFWPD